MSSVHVFTEQLDAILADAVAAELGRKAEEIAPQVRAPRHLEVRTRSGVSKRGAYAQVIMAGPGALTEEFGNRHQAPRAPLRNALRSIA